MNIAIDFDGVILDSETQIAFLADCYSYFELGKKKVRNDDVSPDKCYNWTREEIDHFYNNEFHEATRRAGFVVGAKEMLEKLKADGHKLFIVSKRGFYSKEELVYSEPKLKEFGFDFDGIFFGIDNKVEKCKEIDADIMIEDNPENIEPFLNTNIKIIHLRAKNIYQIKHKNVTEVSNWLEIYKTIKEMA